MKRFNILLKVINPSLKLKIISKIELVSSFNTLCKNNKTKFLEAPIPAKFSGSLLFPESNKFRLVNVETHEEVGTTIF